VGSKRITVTADNAVGSPVTGIYDVEVQGEEDSFDVFLPLVLRSG
jgi:hypothetical protein